MSEYGHDSRLVSTHEFLGMMKHIRAQFSFPDIIRKHYKIIQTPEERIIIRIRNDFSLLKFHEHFPVKWQNPFIPGYFFLPPCNLFYQFQLMFSWVLNSFLSAKLRDNRNFIVDFLNISTHIPPVCFELSSFSK